ncbi:MAG: hypothetical protein ABI591_23480 [Kofleriaceae bacterium]
MVVATRRAVGGIGGVVVVWACAWLALMALRDHPPIAFAAAFDFVVTASAVMYVVAVKPGALPRWALVATFAIGMVFAKLAVMRSSGHAVMVLGIVLELGMVASLIVRGRRSLAARVFLAELRVLSMVVVGWRKPAPAFTVHRLNGWSLYAGVFAFLVLVETAVVHIVLVHYVSVIAAWIVTGLSIYSAAWLIGDALALRHGGLVISDGELTITIGARWRTTVALADIIAVEPAGAADLDLSILGANAVLRLRHPVRVDGLFGRVRHPASIALSIDDLPGFTAAIASASRRP